jgi:hypothetical protein
MNRIAKIWVKSGGSWQEAGETLTTAELAAFKEIVLDPRENSEPPELKEWGTFAEGDGVDVQRAPGLWVAGVIVKVLESDLQVTITKEKKTELYPKTSEDLAPPGSKVARMSKVSFRDIKGAVGLLNMGNTCYLNSSIQCISNTPLLRTFFGYDTYRKYVNTENPMGSNGVVVEQFGQLISQLWNAKSPFLKPDRLRRAIIQKYADFDGNDQHDVHEFLSVLLDILHEDLVRSNQPPLRRTMSRLKNPDRSSMVEYADDQWADRMR